MPIVIPGEAWRKSSCVVFTDAPVDCNSVASVRRKLCQPICFVIPARFAAGYTCRLSTASGQYGRLPSARGLANTQSFGFGWADCSFHFARAEANSEDIGTGRLEASVFGGPSTWSTTDRITRISASAKSTSSHFRPNSSPRRKPVTDANRISVRKGSCNSDRSADTSMRVRTICSC